MKPNLDQLRTFVTVVESGGIHRAVARLHLSQPAASRQIGSLEGALGVPLFDRIGRHLKLTPEGEQIMTNNNCLEGIRCPQCGQELRFYITATITCDVTDHGSEAVGDHCWDDDSLTHCPDCDCHGPLKEFRS